ncbi:MAG TPA: hypothetical protein VGM97_19595 [Steroidobacteraceae bacterium]|jgi:hypothetical protein
MIETNAFLATFAIQILAGSALCPALFIRRVRADALSFPTERFAELFPGVDKIASTERFVTRYRAQNAVITVLGLLLLGWLFTQMGHLGEGGTTVILITVYYLAQLAPQLLIARNAAKYNKRLKASLAEGKRKAVLQRRGLFDFVSPFIVLLAVLSYAVLAALVIYLRQHPYPGFGGFANLGFITLAYAFFALVAYQVLYGRKPNPLVTHADRLYAIGMTIKTLIYTGIGVTVFTLIILTLGLLRLMRWNLFAVDVFFVICVVTPYIQGAIARRRPKGDLLGSPGPLPPDAQNQSA